MYDLGAIDYNNLLGYKAPWHKDTSTKETSTVKVDVRPAPTPTPEPAPTPTKNLTVRPAPTITKTASQPAPANVPGVSSAQIQSSTKKPVIPAGMYRNPYPTSMYNFQRGIPPSNYSLTPEIQDQLNWYYAHPEDYIARKPTILIPQYEANRTESGGLRPGEIPAPLLSPDDPRVPKERPPSVYFDPSKRVQLSSYVYPNNPQGKQAQAGAISYTQYKSGQTNTGGSTSTPSGGGSGGGYSYNPSNYVNNSPSGGGSGGGGYVVVTPPAGNNNNQPTTGSTISDFLNNEYFGIKGKYIAIAAGAYLLLRKK